MLTFCYLTNLWFDLFPRLGSSVSDGQRVQWILFKQLTLTAAKVAYGSKGQPKIVHQPVKNCRKCANKPFR